MKKRRAPASDEDLIKKIGDVEKILSAYDVSKNAFATLFPTPFSLDSPRTFPLNSLFVELTSTEHDESDDIEIEFRDQASQGLCMPGNGVPILIRRFIGSTKAKVIRSDTSVTRVQQGRNNVSVEVGPGGHAVKQ